MLKIIHSVVLASVLSLGLAGCSGSTFTAIGSITVPVKYPVTKDGNLVSSAGNTDFDTIQLEDGGPCKAASGYDDISAGSQVTLTNGSGEVVATGNLGNGMQSNSEGWSYANWLRVGKGVAMCSFSFQITDVPGGGNFYQVSLGNNNRGEISYSEDELKAGIALKLGQ
jgi:hypothetical protein